MTESRYPRSPIEPLLVRTPPLPTLLGRAIGAFTLDYEQARGGDGSIPQLGTWANALRVVDAEGTDQRQLARRAVISTRAAEVVVNRLDV